MNTWKELAKKNGIHRKTFSSRVELGWDPERAATEPPKKKVARNDRKWIKLAEQNGILYDTYLKRIEQGWSPEDAAIKPLKAKNKREDKEWMKIAEENGISRGTYRSRVDLMWWTPEEAATTKVLTKEKMIQRMVETNSELNEIRWERLNQDPNNLFKLTPEHFETAERNGIPRATVNARIFRAGWTVKDAITLPLMNRKTEEFYEFLEIAKENGIPYDVFRKRVSNGWSYVDAATKAVRDNSKRRRLDGVWLEKASQNGIKRTTYTNRIKLGWTPEEAATFSPLKKGEHLNEQTKEKSLEGYRKFRKYKTN